MISRVLKFNSSHSAAFRLPDLVLLKQQYHEANILREALAEFNRRSAIFLQLIHPRSVSICWTSLQHSNFWMIFELFFVLKPVF